MTIIDTTPGPDLVRLKSHGGSDELNVSCTSYRPDHRNAFWVRREHVTHETLAVGAFYVAPLTLAEALEDVENAVARAESVQVVLRAWSSPGSYPQASK